METSEPSAEEIEVLSSNFNLVRLQLFRIHHFITHSTSQQLISHFTTLSAKLGYLVEKSLELDSIRAISSANLPLSPSDSTPTPALYQSWVLWSAFAETHHLTILPIHGPAVTLFLSSLQSQLDLKKIVKAIELYRAATSPLFVGTNPVKVLGVGYDKRIWVAWEELVKASQFGLMSWNGIKDLVALSKVAREPPPPAGAPSTSAANVRPLPPQLQPPLSPIPPLIPSAPIPPLSSTLSQQIPGRPFPKHVQPQLSRQPLPQPRPQPQSQPQPQPQLRQQQPPNQDRRIHVAPNTRVGPSLPIVRNNVPSRSSSAHSQSRNQTQRPLPVQEQPSPKTILTSTFHPAPSTPHPAPSTSHPVPSTSQPPLIPQVPVLPAPRFSPNSKRKQQEDEAWELEHVKRAKRVSGDHMVGGREIVRNESGASSSVDWEKEFESERVRMEDEIRGIEEKKKKIERLMDWQKQLEIARVDHGRRRLEAAKRKGKEKEVRVQEEEDDDDVIVISPNPSSSTIPTPNWNPPQITQFKAAPHPSHPHPIPPSAYTQRPNPQLHAHTRPHYTTQLPNYFKNPPPQSRPPPIPNQPQPQPSNFISIPNRQILPPISNHNRNQPLPSFPPPSFPPPSHPYQTQPPPPSHQPQPQPQPQERKRAGPSTRPQPPTSTQRQTPSRMPSRPPTPSSRTTHSLQSFLTPLEIQSLLQENSLHNEFLDACIILDAEIKGYAKLLSESREEGLGGGGGVVLSEVGGSLMDLDGRVGERQGTGGGEIGASNYGIRHKDTALFHPEASTSSGPPLPETIGSYHIQTGSGSTSPVVTTSGPTIEPIYLVPATSGTTTIPTIMRDDRSSLPVSATVAFTPGPAVHLASTMIDISASIPSSMLIPQLDPVSFRGVPAQTHSSISYPQSSQAAPQLTGLGLSICKTTVALPSVLCISQPPPPAAITATLKVTPVPFPQEDPASQTFSPLALSNRPSQVGVSNGPYHGASLSPVSAPAEVTTSASTSSQPFSNTTSTTSTSIPAPQDPARALVLMFQNASPEKKLVIKEALRKAIAAKDVNKVLSSKVIAANADRILMGMLEDRVDSVEEVAGIGGRKEKDVVGSTSDIEAPPRPLATNLRQPSPSATTSSLPPPTTTAEVDEIKSPDEAISFVPESPTAPLQNIQEEVAPMAKEQEVEKDVEMNDVSSSRGKIEQVASIPDTSLIVTTPALPPSAHSSTSIASTSLPCQVSEVASPIASTAISSPVLSPMPSPPETLLPLVTTPTPATTPIPSTNPTSPLEALLPTAGTEIIVETPSISASNPAASPPVTSEPASAPASPVVDPLVPPEPLSKSPELASNIEVSTTESVRKQDNPKEGLQVASSAPQETFVGPSSVTSHGEAADFPSPDFSATTSTSKKKKVTVVEVVVPPPSKAMRVSFSRYRMINTPLKPFG